jgi:hypothetical protein
VGLGVVFCDFLGAEPFGFDGLFFPEPELPFLGASLDGGTCLGDLLNRRLNKNELTLGLLAAEYITN